MNNKAFLKFAITAILYAACLGSLVVFLMMPENKYEWMLQGNTTSIEESQLPTDDNAIIRQVLFLAPIVLFIAITLLTSSKIHSKPWLIATTVFCLAVLAVSILKVIF